MSTFDMIAIFCWLHFLGAIFVAVLESKKGSKILRYGGGAVFIWLISPYTDEGIKTNSDKIIWWARISFIIAVGSVVINNVVS